jgi:hypothetical protein
VNFETLTFALKVRKFTANSTCLNLEIDPESGSQMFKNLKRVGIHHQIHQHRNWATFTTQHLLKMILSEFASSTCLTATSIPSLKLLSIPARAGASQNMTVSPSTRFAASSVLTVRRTRCAFLFSLFAVLTLLDLVSL